MNLERAYTYKYKVQKHTTLAKPSHLTTPSTMASNKPLKIAILINTDEIPYATMMTTSYTHIFTSLSPSSVVTFFHPITSQTYPDPSVYGLLVVGGGTYIPDETLPWYLKEMDFLHTLTDHPTLKIVYICFGHQKLAQVLGGALGYMAAPEVCSPFYQ